MVDQRRERRFPLDLAADLAVLSHGAEKLPARTLDVSRSGLRLRVAKPIEPGAFVEVRWPSYAIFGEVRHCSQADDGLWNIGIEIQQAMHRDAIKGDHLPANFLSLFLAGSLSRRETKTAGEHLATCPMCKLELARIEDLALARLLEFAKQNPAKPKKPVPETEKK